MSQISEELGLSTSTVSQHLKELESHGMIEQLDNSFSKKWKYYAARDSSTGRIYNKNGISMENKIIVTVVAAIVLVALIAIGLASLNTSSQNGYKSIYLAPGAQLPTGATAFTVSDSPAVSSVSAVNVSISNLSVHSTTSGKWYTFNESASAQYNLAALRNISALVVAANIPQGAYNEIVLHVSNASVTVNGTEKPAFLPSGKLIIPVQFNVSDNTTNWFNLDFNLSKSVHVTGNGRVILMPVINIDSKNGYNLTANENGTVSSSGKGNSRVILSEGMDENGTMHEGFYIPQNASVSISNGHVSVSVSTANTPVVIVANGHLYLVVNTSLSTITNIGAAAGSKIRCASESGSVECNTSSSANVSESIPEIIGISIGAQSHNRASVSNSGNVSSSNTETKSTSSASGTSNTIIKTTVTTNVPVSASGSVGINAGGSGANMSAGVNAKSIQK
jgi:DNA-binding transcriptional ArsR family regulator